MSAPSIRKNFVYSTLYQILDIIVPFITAPYLSRVLGPDMVGIQSYTASIQAYFLLIAALGTQSYGAREISRNRDDISTYSKLFWEIELMSIVTSAASLTAWGLLIILSPNYRIFYLVMIPNILGSMLNISWLFNGLEKFKLTVIRNMLFRLTGVVLMFLFIKEKSDVVIHVGILSFINLLSSISLWLYVPRLTIRIPFKQLTISRHFKQTLAYFIPTIATSIYTVLDKTLIGLITDDNTQNGFYEQAENIMRIANRVSYSGINAVVGVRISYLFKENKLDEIHERIANSINYIFFMGVGCACGISAIARKFVPFFLGDGYGGVEYLLYIFCPISVIIGISNCLGSHYYTPSGRRTQSSKYLIIGSCVNLVLNLCLIPYFQAIGAAIASIVAELTITVLYVQNSNHYMTARMLFQIGWKKIVSGTCMLVFVFVLGNLLNLPEIIAIMIQISAGLGFYITMLYLLRDNWTMNYVHALLNKAGKRLNLEAKTRDGQ